MKRGATITLRQLSAAGYKEYETDKFASGEHIKEMGESYTGQPGSVKKKRKSIPKLPKLDPFLKLCEIGIGIVPEPEYRFHPVRKWRFDYAFVDLKISVEKEGGIRRPGGGAHSRPANIERDVEKYTEAAVMGWIVIRRTPKQLCTEETIELIKRACQR